MLVLVKAEFCFILQNGHMHAAVEKADRYVKSCEICILCGV